MGLPEGFITAVPGISRNDMHKLAGNGVCPQQGELALRMLLNVTDPPAKEETAGGSAGRPASR